MTQTTYEVAPTVEQAMREHAIRCRKQCGMTDKALEEDPVVTTDRVRAYQAALNKPHGEALLDVRWRVIWRELAGEVLVKAERAPTQGIVWQVVTFSFSIPERAKDKPVLDGKLPRETRADKLDVKRRVAKATLEKFGGASPAFEEWALGVLLEDTTQETPRLFAREFSLVPNPHGMILFVESLSAAIQEFADPAIYRVPFAALTYPRKFTTTTIVNGLLRARASYRRVPTHVADDAINQIRALLHLQRLEQEMWTLLATTPEE